MISGAAARGSAEGGPQRFGRVAYFSMEIAIDERMPTYAGGLGVLAGDMLRSCADLEVPVVAVTLLWRNGYFDQKLDARGVQLESPATWQPERFLTELPVRVEVEIEGRKVPVRVFERQMIGASGFVVPILLLDADVAQNALYGGDEQHRLAQEIVLGIGGVRVLDALGYRGGMMHLNEGHAALAAVEVLRELRQRVSRGRSTRRGSAASSRRTRRRRGHDQIRLRPRDAHARRRAPARRVRVARRPRPAQHDAARVELSHYVNGVARKQGELHDIRHVTNGVHSVTWTSEPFRRLFDCHLPQWRETPRCCAWP